MTKSEMPRYLMPVKEVAAELGVTVQRVHQLAAEGKITPEMKAPGLRGAAFYLKSEVQRYKEERSK